MPSTSTATRSVPPSPDDVDDGSRAPRRATFVGEPSNTVGFLDAPGLDGTQLAAAVDEALATLDARSILTVYNDRPGAPDAIADVCERQGVELVTTIDHEAGGSTFTLRRPVQRHPTDRSPRVG